MPWPKHGGRGTFANAWARKRRLDDLVVTDDLVNYHWTFTGTSAETGKSVRIPGFEEWTIGADGLIAEPRGYYDKAEYDRQVREGAAAG